MSGYHLAYSQTEDRLLLSLGDHEPVVALTRRLTRELLKSIGRILADQKAGTPAGDARVRDTVLNFEQSRAVSGAYAEGQARQETRKKPDAAAIKLAVGVDITVKKSESLTFTFKDDAALLRLALDIKGSHLFMSSLFDLATTAGWDFPELVSWLEAKPSADPARTETKILH